MSTKQNPNWIETEKGWIKNDQSSARGTSPFDKPIPPVRDGNGFPLRSDGSGKIDWNLLAQERAAQRGKA